MRTNYHKKNFTSRLALKDRLSGTQKWSIETAKFSEETCF